MPNADTITDTQIELLNFIYGRMVEGHVSLSYSKIGNHLELSKPSVMEAIERLENNGFLEVDRSATPFLYEKTRSGEALHETWENNPPVSDQSPNDPLIPPSDKPLTNYEMTRDLPTPQVNVHDFGVEMPFSEDCLIARENRETILSEFPEILQYDEGNGEFYGDWDRFHFRISGGSVVIYMRGKESGGLSVRYVKNKALDEIRRCREYLEENLNLRFRDDVVVEGRVISQDIAVEDHPLVVMARRSGLRVRPENFCSMDEDGNVRLKLDMSHGTYGEVEASMRGAFSSDARCEEKDIQSLLDSFLWKSQNWETWDDLKRIGSERDNINTILTRLVESEFVSGMVEPNDSDRSGDSEDINEALNRMERHIKSETLTPKGQDVAETTTPNSLPFFQRVVEAFKILFNR